MRSRAISECKFLMAKGQDSAKVYLNIFFLFVHWVNIEQRPSPPPTHDTCALYTGQIGEHNSGFMFLHRKLGSEASARRFLYFSSALTAFGNGNGVVVAKDSFKNPFALLAVCVQDLCVYVSTLGAYELTFGCCRRRRFSCGHPQAKGRIVVMLHTRVPQRLTAAVPFVNFRRQHQIFLKEKGELRTSIVRTSVKLGGVRENWRFATWDRFRDAAIHRILVSSLSLSLCVMI